MNAGWMRSAAKLSDISVLNRSQLIVPCFGSSRIYLVAVENQSSLRISKVKTFKCFFLLLKFWVSIIVH